MYVGLYYSYLSGDNGLSYNLDTSGFDEFSTTIDSYYLFKDTVYAVDYPIIYKKSINDIKWSNFSEGIIPTKVGQGNFFSIADTLFFATEDRIHKSFKGSKWSYTTNWNANGKVISIKNHLFQYFSSLHRTHEASRNWIDILSNFPSQKINVLIANKDRLFAGTNEEIFYSDDLGNSWKSSKKGIQGNPIINLCFIKNDLFATSNNKIFNDYPLLDTWFIPCIFQGSDN